MFLQSKEIFYDIYNILSPKELNKVQEKYCELGMIMESEVEELDVLSCSIKRWL